ncbi:hypothetical protein [Bacillus sp. 123MFChir2]|uniref:hypothetical protein n=1 Tax=Bacillus sp. 123MFChir2 TaxID=1169144 RepID=UPI000378B86E|nr:hypothetical protein [Bacillus sp. 123MFChir2]
MMEKKVKDRMNAMQLLYVLLAVFGFIPGILTGMIFDAPGSENDIFRQCIFYSYPCFVLTFLVTAILARIFYQRGQYKVVRWLNVLPLFWFFWFAFWVYYWVLQEK